MKNHIKITVMLMLVVGSMLTTQTVYAVKCPPTGIPADDKACDPNTTKFSQNPNYDPCACSCDGVSLTPIASMGRMLHYTTRLLIDVLKSVDEIEKNKDKIKFKDPNNEYSNDGVKIFGSLISLTSMISSMLRIWIVYLK